METLLEKFTGIFPSTGDPNLDAFANDLEHANILDDRWNKLFQAMHRMKGQSPRDRFYLKVSALQDAQGQDLTQNGVMRYIHIKDQSKANPLNLNSYRNIRPEDIELVERPADASVFDERELKELIQAIQSNAAFKTDRDIKFTQERVTQRQRESIDDYARVVLDEYFINKCRHDEKSLEYISELKDRLFQLIKDFKEPLVGNGLIDILVNAYMDPNIRNYYKPTEHSLIILNDLIADRYFSSKALKTPASFKATLMFNKELNKWNVDDIEELLDLYSDARSITADNIANNSLRNWDKVEDQLPRQLVLKKSGASNDAFADAIMENTDIPFRELNLYGVTPESNAVLLDTPRDLAAIRTLIDAIAPTQGEDETDRDLYLIQNETSVLKGYEETVLDSDPIFVFTKRNDADEKLSFKEKDRIGFVLFAPRSRSRMIRKKEPLPINLTPENIRQYQNFIQLKSDRKGFEVVKGFRGVLEIHLNADKSQIVKIVIDELE